MDKMFQVIKREYLFRVKKKSFLIMTLLVPLIFIILIGVVIFANVYKEEKIKKIVIVDETEQVADSLAASMNSWVRNGKNLYNAEKWEIEDYRVITPNGSFNVDPSAEGEISAPKKAIMDKVEAKEIDGFIFMDKDALQTNSVDYYTRSVASFMQNESIDRAVTNIFRRWRAVQRGMSRDDMYSILGGVSLNVKRSVVSEEGKEIEEKGPQSFFVAYFFVLILYMTTLIFGQIIMRSVLEEKTTRIIEVIVSSVKPFHILMGKMLGVGAVCLTQFFIWMVSLFLLFQASGPVITALDIPFDTSTLTKYFDVYLPILLYFFVFFILGFFQFSSLYAGVGAAANTDEEAQQMQFPIIMLAMIPYFFMMLVANSPDSTLAVVLSMIPGFVPMIMFMRVCILMPPFYEVWGAILIQTLFIIFTIWIVSKIYRVGILMYGKKPNLKELVKWIRQS
ncbi:ABC transporter permease [candidate division KSB1 bacterium]